MEHESTKLYKVREFAKLAGVTVRALHHYDRLGLLTPTRRRALGELGRRAGLDSLQTRHPGDRDAERDGVVEEVLQPGGA